VLHGMSLTVLIILCLAIVLALIIFPLIVSYRAEKSKKQDEWDKIAAYGKKINEKSRKNKLH
jgi:cytochrome bd-type quinol oxidase subunit 2